MDIITPNYLKTYVTSVKKSAPVVGWILMSFSELNCLPKKLSKSTVTLWGAFGLTSAMDGGNGPRPEVIRTREDLSGPVPPFVI